MFMLAPVSRLPVPGRLQALCTCLKLRPPTPDPAAWRTQSLSSSQRETLMKGSGRSSGGGRTTRWRVCRRWLLASGGHPTLPWTARASPGQLALPTSRSTWWQMAAQLLLLLLSQPPHQPSHRPSLQTTSASSSSWHWCRGWERVQPASTTSCTAGFSSWIFQKPGEPRQSFGEACCAWCGLGSAGLGVPRGLSARVGVC